VAYNSRTAGNARQPARMTLMEALQYTLSFKTADENQTTAQREIVNALQRAMEARRQGIVISQSTVSSVKWAAILLQGLCTLIAIAMVHSDNRIMRHRLDALCHGRRNLCANDRRLYSSVYGRDFRWSRSLAAGASDH